MLPKYRVWNHNTHERFTVYGYSEVLAYLQSKPLDYVTVWRDEKPTEPTVVFDGIYYQPELLFKEER